MNYPTEREYNPYFGKYIYLVQPGNIHEMLMQNMHEAMRFFKSIPENKIGFRYAPDKWDCKDILMHIIDTERVMQYRALVALRGDDSTPLPPVDENLYAKNVDLSKRTMEELIDEFELVRKSTAKLFEHFTEEQASFLANGGTHPISARALAYILQGHVMHHINIIRERYLQSSFS